MAKEVMPPAELEPRPTDVDLPFPLYSMISLFAGLKQPPTYLAQFPGAYRLRFFCKGEVICRHGEAGWSAFYLLTRDDVVKLHTHPARRTEQAPAEKAKQEDLLRRAAENLAAVEAQLANQALAAREQADLKKKLGALQKEIEKLQASTAELSRELGELPALRERLERQIQLPPEPAVKVQPAATALPESEDGKEPVAIVSLPPGRQRARAGGWLSGLRHWLFGPGSQPTRPAYIPNDGPRDLDYNSRLASLHEGELFGEFACTHRAPRSATVFAARDCYVLEIMRNILEKLQKDEEYKRRSEEAIRCRLRDITLREISLFAPLGPQRLRSLAERVELVQYPPGTLICDEHEEADGAYVIGSGIVKVMTGASWLIPADAPLDWAALRAELLDGSKQAAGPARLLWERLPADVQKDVVEQADGLPAPARARLVRSLNRLVQEPAFHRAPAWEALVRDLGGKVWAMLARPGLQSAQGLARCNRLLIQNVDAQVYPAWQAPGPGEQPGFLFRPEEIVDWKKFTTRVPADDKPAGEPIRALWDLLPEAVREVLRRGKGTDLSAEDRGAVVAALNGLVQGPPLLLLQDFHAAVLNGKLKVADKLLELLPEGHRWTDYDGQRWNRALNRLLLGAVCPRGLGELPRPTGLPNILAYCGRDETIGEMGLFERRPRSATVVTYNHPEDDPAREVGPVVMVRIPTALFDELLADVPAIRARVAEVVSARRAEDEKRRADPAAAAGATLLQSQRAEELGLIQGRRLMLIDLDRCTRCDECVQACVNTHDDGRSRLFLNGPRFDHYVVPTTCRSCLDPVCMIGCPVGSIHRGGNGQIVIEDWCIGCARCERQCPYGSIQMHDVGVVPEGAHGWRFLPARLVGADWIKPHHRDRDWLTDRAPFVFHRAFQEGLPEESRSAGRQPMCFRRRFDLGPGLQANTEYTLELVSADPNAQVWLNGIELKTEEKVKRSRRLFAIAAGGQVMRSSGNVLAVRVDAAAGAAGDVFFDLRLDPLRRLEGLDVEIKQVTSLAVVCDLCSSLPTGPACVTACPHEAARRVDARTEL